MEKILLFILQYRITKETGKEMNRIENRIIELEESALELYLNEVGIDSVIRRCLEPNVTEEYDLLKRKQEAILTEIVLTS